MKTNFNALKRGNAAVVGSLFGASLAAVLMVTSHPAAAADCKDMRKVNVSVSTSPPNVVHTTPIVAKELGLFAKHCLDVTIVQFEGGQSPAARAAVAQGSVIATVNDVMIGRGVKVQQFWGNAPKLPQIYAGSADTKVGPDLKGKKFSASGGGVGGFQWRMGRELLRTVGLTVDDVIFVSQGTAGRVPGLLTGQINAVALSPEDYFIATTKNKTIHPLIELSKLMPNYIFNSYGAQSEWIQRDPALFVDVAASMIEASRIMYREPDRVIPIMMKATGAPKDAVEFAWKSITKNCGWAVNEGFNRDRTNWTVDNSVSVGDIEAAKKPTFEQVVNMKIATAAVEKAGGRVKIGECTE